MKIRCKNEGTGCSKIFRGGRAITALKCDLACRWQKGNLPRWGAWQLSDDPDSPVTAVAA